jgi:hypothetical protein
VKLSFNRLHEILLRNGYYVPKQGGFCNVEYLKAVKENRIACPKFEDIKMRPCPV